MNEQAPTAESATGEGLATKYHVFRVDGRDSSSGDKRLALYFVLDYWHDPHARKALSAYAESVHAENPDLASDLRRALMRTESEGAPGAHIDGIAPGE